MKSNHKYINTAVLCANLAVVLILGCTSDHSVTPDQPPPWTDQVGGILRTDWIPSSRPVVIDDSLSERARMAWYNPIDPIPATEIWDSDIPAGQSGLVRPLMLEYQPVDFIRVKDTVDMIIDSTTIQIPPELSWNGITACLPRSAYTVFDEASFLDIRLRGDVGIMHIDLGRISEDIDGDGWLDNEDRDHSGVLDYEEDIGLDGLPDSLEFGYDPGNGVFDPAGDNFFFDYPNIDIWRINGTEGNRDDPDGGYIPDTEDRNFNGLERIDSYFSYRVDLSDNSSHYVPQSRNEYGWKTIRLPVGEMGVSDATTGDPDWSNIEFFRIWFDSVPASYMDNSLKVELAAIKLDVSYDTVTPPQHLETMVIRDIDYRKQFIYDLGRLQRLRSRTDTLPEPDKYDFAMGDSILKAIAYYDDQIINNNDPSQTRAGICYVDPTDTLSDDPQSDYRTTGYFEPIDEVDYFIHPTQFYTQFLRSMIGSDDVFGVYMEVRRADGTVDTIGNISSDTLRLKLIKPKHYVAVNHHVWEYEWRNAYWLGAYSIDLCNLDIHIYKGSPVDNYTINPNDPDNQDGISYLQILGLDHGDNHGYPPPDCEIDRYVHIDAALGMLYFPNRYPFDSPIGYAVDQFSGDTIYLNDSVPEIYLDTNYAFQGQWSKYYLGITRLVQQ